MIFTDNTGKDHIFEFKYDSYLKETALYLEREDYDVRPPTGINLVSVLGISDIKSKNERWNKYIGNTRMPKDLQEYLEKLTTDEYLQLL